jgi:hypothetical protein
MLFLVCPTLVYGTILVVLCFFHVLLTKYAQSFDFIFISIQMV